MFPSPSDLQICDIYAVSYNLQTDFSIVAEVDANTPQKFIIAFNITFTAI